MRKSSTWWKRTWSRLLWHVCSIWNFQLDDGWCCHSGPVNWLLSGNDCDSYWVYGRRFFLVPRIAWWLSMVMLVYQRVKTPFSCGCLMVFLWSSRFPMVFSHDFPHFHMVFLGFSSCPMAFAIVVPFSYGFSYGYVCKPWPAWLSLSSSFWPGIRSMLRCRELSWT